MSRCPLAHFPLAPKPPVTSSCDRKVVFEVVLSAEGGSIQLIMRQRDREDQEYIAIDEDCEVVILLRGKQLYLSKEFDAITMKNDFKFFYGGAVYGEYDPKTERYQSFSFHARHNKGGKVGTTHGFNINVDLWQPGGKPEWIGLSIDPDIKNPPPKISL